MFVCENCGAELNCKQKKFCSTKCFNEFISSKNEDKFKNGEIVTTTTLRKYLSSLYGNKCSICSTSEWCGKQLVLIVDHINGNASDNSPSNLRLLCPNCDSQTNTYKGKNFGKGRYYRKMRYLLGKSF